MTTARLAWIALAVGCAVGMPSPRGLSADQPVVPVPAQARPEMGDSVERKVLELINIDRRKAGRLELSMDPVLVRTARRHSAEMRDRRYFSHSSPVRGRESVLDRYRIELGKEPEFSLLGENLFMAEAVDAVRAHAELMRSPGHRKNILEAGFSHAGIGSERDAEGSFWLTEVFLGKPSER